MTPRLERPIFVVGSARSGTVLMGRILKGHPMIHCLIERPAVFNYASHLGLNPTVKQKHPAHVRQRLRSLYEQNWRASLGACRKCSDVCRRAAAEIGAEEWPCGSGDGLRYADKSHQHVLNVDAILDAFPDACFVHLIRDGRDVVASMLRHEGVLNWFGPAIINEQSEFPQPWFGIRDHADLARWQRLSVAGKCARRWVSWTEAGLQASRFMPADRWVDVRYEDLVTDPANTIDPILRGFELYPHRVDTPIVRSDSVGSWRTRLNAQDAEEVTAVAGSLLDQLGYRLEATKT